MAKRRSLDDKNCLSSTEDVRGLPGLHAANWEQDSPTAHTSGDQNPEHSTGTTAGPKGFPSLIHGTFSQANEQEPRKRVQWLPDSYQRLLIEVPYVQKMTGSIVQQDKELSIPSQHYWTLSFRLGES